MISISCPIIEEMLGVVLPNSPCMSSLMYAPACVVTSIMMIFGFSVEKFQEYKYVYQLGKIENTV